jgi:hypothetical protein
MGPASASASAISGILPTSTTVAAGPGVVTDAAASTVTLTATVGFLGLLLTPSGVVTFTVFAPGSAIGVAADPPATLGRCIILLTKCTASRTIQVGGAAPGVYTVVAHYEGDDLSTASTGSTSFTVIGVAGAPVEGD